MSSRRFRRPSFGVGLARNIRKSVSCEPLMDLSSSEDEDRGGGARLSTSSLTPSPAGKQTMFLSKAASETGGSPASSSNSFQLGTNNDDDVFASNESSLPSFGRTRTLVYRPKHAVLRNNELNEHISPDHGAHNFDAQDIYPQNACIFVANLLQTAEDSVLEYEVTRVFSRFGRVFVKIKRDNFRQMPHAFCQFTTVKDAELAESEGKGTVILGRPCRTEMTRAHATFLVWKVSGQPTYDTEAIRLLEQLGEISKAERLSESIQRKMKLPPAIVVTYKMYNTHRDVVGTFRGHKSFRVISYDPKFIPMDRHEPNDDAVLVHTHRYRHGQNPLADYDRDRRSAYMGNLPSDMTADRLESIVDGCGTVVSIELKQKPIDDTYETYTCFAFVEYDRPDSADTLVNTLNLANIDGHIIRVSRKESRTFRGAPHAKYDTIRPNYSTQGAFAKHKPRPGYGRPHAKDIFRSHDPEEDIPTSNCIAQEYEGYSQASKEPTSEEKHSHGSSSQAATPGAKARSMATLDTPRPRDIHEVPMSPPFTMSHFSSPHPYMQWVPPYSPHSFTPLSPYGHIPAQGAPAMMYGNMFSSPVYPGMYPEMFGIYSPVPGMGPPLGGEEVASGHNTPTRPSQDKASKEAAEPEREVADNQEKSDQSS